MKLSTVLIVVGVIGAIAYVSTRPASAANGVTTGTPINPLTGQPFGANVSGTKQPVPQPGDTKASAGYDLASQPGTTIKDGENPAVSVLDQALASFKAWFS